MNKQVTAFTLFLMVVLLFVAGETPLPSISYIHEDDTAATPVTGESSSLYDQLEEAADTYNEPPVDAVIDKVWKAIPGYSGRMLDIKASYQAMQKVGEFEKTKLVFENIPPEVSLEDLPPAPIYKGNPKKPMASLLINVSWGEEYLPEILKTLREEKVKATFFLEGRWVQKHPKLAKMIKEEGHEIGSHAYSHPDLNASTASEIRKELRQTNEALEAVLSLEPDLFAPPSGSYNDEVVKIAREMGMYTILWTADTVDWKKPDPYDMAVKTSTKVDNGSMILMHPTASAAGGLKEMIRLIKEKHIQLDTVSRLLDETRIHSTD